MSNCDLQPDDHQTERYSMANRFASRIDQNDYPVDVKSRESLFKNPGFLKGLSALLFLLAAIFLIGFIVSIYSKSKPRICTSDECLRTAANLKFSMDINIDPCNNFYQYTCGKWTEEHFYHGWSLSTITTVADRLSMSSVNALKSKEYELGAPEALNKSRDFYTSCMNEDTIDSMGLTPMYQYLKEAELPVVPTIFTKTDTETSNYSFNWMKSEILLKRIFMMDVFIGFRVLPNMYNHSENVIYLGTINLKRRLRSSLKTKMKVDNKEHKLKKKIESHIMKFAFKEIAMNVTGKPLSDEKLQEASDIITNMTDIVDELLSNHTNYNFNPDDIRTITFKALQKETDNILPSLRPNFWYSYITYLFTGINVTIDPDNDLLYTTDLWLKYLYKILQFVSEKPGEHLELYIWWTAVNAMIGSTSSNVTLYTNQLKYLSSGTISRSLECAVKVTQYMSYAVTYAIADQSFANTTRLKVEQMVKELKRAFVDHLNGIQWMDDKTKEVTVEKSKEMLAFVGFPDWLIQEGKLDKYYEDVYTQPNTYLSNIINVTMSLFIKKLKLLRTKRDRRTDYDSTVVNAFYYPYDNAIIFPMAILNFPLNNLGLEVLNYGSIGAILGHELTHGFDNQGRKFNKLGDLVQWWSNDTIEIYENFTKCFIDQYDNMKIEGVMKQVNGTLTLSENLADNGGLNQAYAAYKNYLAQHGEEQQLPGFENFTSYQMFFIAFGSSYCGTATIKELENLIDKDSHSPYFIRVLATLQNSQDFANAFNCPVGSFMNPLKKCQIW